MVQSRDAGAFGVILASHQLIREAVTATTSATPS
jgi:hypothetical protein